MKDQLFLLRPGFFNAGLEPLYCGESVAVEGLLSFAPTLRESVDVHYIDFARPRPALVAVLGEARQSVPVLILGPGAVIKDGGIQPPTANGRRYIDDERTIRRYLSTQYDQPIAG